MKKNIALYLLILGFPALLAFVSDAIQEWYYLFDDAFITYRYAKNLALGHGITWNSGAAPTEGYTNFLFVVLLAPFIKIGWDPLLVTRVLSYVSAIAMTIMVFFMAKRRHGYSTPVALTIGALIMLVPNTSTLCLTGLETVIYSLFLLVTFHVSVEFIHSRRNRDAVACSTLLILTMLLRPEAALLYPVLFILYCANVGLRQRSELKPLMLGLLVALSLGSTYLAWKFVYFGHLLPNPFYIKVWNHSYISAMGFGSIQRFFGSYALLLALLYPSLVLCLPEKSGCRHKHKSAVILGIGFITMHLCFYAHTDTLMDIGGRFLYPLVPIVIYLVIPVLGDLLTAIESRIHGRAFHIFGILTAFLLAFAPHILEVPKNVKRLVPDNSWETSDSVTQVEYCVAKTLATFPDIETVRIACGDSGVMPYLTNAVWLDPVGLNDGFIARTRDQKELVDYFFKWQPDLVLQAGYSDYSWSYGHGPLGDYPSWLNDPRWNEYSYVGTVKAGYYDLQFLVRKSSRFHQPLKGFLQANVVEGWYDPFPYPIGTQQPNKEIEPTWIPRTD